MYSQAAIFYLWDAWFASWVIAALWADRPTGWPDIRSQALHWLVTLVGLYLLLGVYADERRGAGADRAPAMLGVEMLGELERSPFEWPKISTPKAA